jgi:DNA-binding transcriptional LysR family regulator
VRRAGLSAEKGQPQSVADLPQHTAINYLRAGRVLPWQLMDNEGTSHTFTPRSSLNMDDLQAICDAALAGHGIAWLPCWMASKEIHQGKLVPLLKQAPDVRFDVHAVWQQDAASAAEGENCRRYAGEPFTAAMSLDLPAPIKKPR